MTCPPSKQLQFAPTVYVGAMTARARQYTCYAAFDKSRCSTRADHQSIRILLSSFDLLERDTILKGFSLCLRPADTPRTLFKTFNRCAPFKPFKLPRPRPPFQLFNGPTITT